MRLDPEYGGFTFRLSSIRNGTPPAALVTAFVTSTEFVQTYGNLNDTAFIQQIYLNTLGRAATQADLDFWVPIVPQLGRGEIARQFITSPEFNLRHRARQLANMLYLGFLGRSPELAGRVFWTNELNNGASELTVVNNFVTSVEFLTRLPSFPAN